MQFLVFILVFLILLAIIIACQKSDFRVSREIIINAPADVVFAEINDFHRWYAWSPWAKMDPDCINTFEGTPAGVGSVFKWDGNKKVGAGIMTIAESKPGELIKIDMQFLKPFKGRNTAEFAFKSQGAETVLSWTMYGKNSFMGKAVGLVMDCEKMVGGQFEKGLAAIKSIAESKK